MEDRRRKPEPCARKPWSGTSGAGKARRPDPEVGQVARRPSRPEKAPEVSKEARFQGFHGTVQGVVEGKEDGERRFPEMRDQGQDADRGEGEEGVKRRGEKREVEGRRVEGEGDRAPEEGRERGDEERPRKEEDPE